MKTGWFSGSVEQAAWYFIKYGTGFSPAHWRLCTSARPCSKQSYCYFYLCFYFLLLLPLLSHHCLTELPSDRKCFHVELCDIYVLILSARDKAQIWCFCTFFLSIFLPTVSAYVLPYHTSSASRRTVYLTYKEICSVLTGYLMNFAPFDILSSHRSFVKRQNTAQPNLNAKLIVGYFRRSCACTLQVEQNKNLYRGPSPARNMAFRRR